MLSNCGAGNDSWKSLGQQGDFICQILKEINPEHSLEGLMLKLMLQYIWPPDAKSWLIGKDPDAGKYWRQEEKGMTEDEIVGWHHQLNGHEFWWSLGVGDGQGGLACCASWGRKESDTTEWLNGMGCHDVSETWFHLVYPCCSDSLIRNSWLALSFQRLSSLVVPFLKWDLPLYYL